MKRVFNFRNAAIALVTVLTTAMAPVINATEVPGNNNVEMKFIGNFRNKPVFELNFATPAEYVINIRDEYGNSLYREVVKSSTTSKKFMLNADESAEDNLRFVITNKQTGTTDVYEINYSTRTIAETSVTKVNY